MPSALRLSIALATYNGARYLGEQLESFVRQRRPPDELVVCDDASTDDTPAILRDFEKHAPFPVRIEVNPERLGGVGNFTRAISLCSGDAILLSDQDDVWLPEKVAALESSLAGAPGATLAFGDTSLVDGALRPLGHTGFDSLGLRGGALAKIEAGHVLEALLRFNVVTGAAMAFRAELRDLALPVGRGWVHDEWIAAIASAVGSVVVIDRPLILYRQHDHQQIGLPKRGFLEKVDRAWRMGEPYMLRALERAEALRDRLRESDRPLLHSSYRALLDGKCLHARRRLEMRRGASRPGEVARALVRGDYARFDRGWAAALQDLFMP